MGRKDALKSIVLRTKYSKAILILLVLVSCCYFLQLGSSSTVKEENKILVIDEEEMLPAAEEASKTWITMALCWSANAQVHHKDKFPYKESAPLSSQLWMKFSPAKVILQIVYSETQVPQELQDYKRDCESHGIIVFLVPTGSDMKCVLKSQLIRLLAYSLPMIKDNDVLVTADVDAFVMTEDIYKPLLLPDKQIWLYRYALTYDTGSTFMMPFIGIKAKAWKTMFRDYDTSRDLPDQGLLGNGLAQFVEVYGQKMDLSYTWEIDQHILSHAILNSGLCSLPRDNKLWKELNLEPK